jgi:hypothetical protein
MFIEDVLLFEWRDFARTTQLSLLCDGQSDLRGWRVEAWRCAANGTLLSWRSSNFFASVGCNTYGTWLLRGPLWSSSVVIWRILTEWPTAPPSCKDGNGIR